MQGKQQSAQNPHMSRKQQSTCNPHIMKQQQVESMKQQQGKQQSIKR